MPSYRSVQVRGSEADLENKDTEKFLIYRIKVPANFSTN